MTSVNDSLAGFLEGFDSSSIPCNTTGSQETMEIENGLRVLADACAATTDIDDDQLFDTLADADIPDELAERILAFGPIGFAHVVLYRIRLPLVYELMSECGEELGFRDLADEPVFVVAMQVAASLAPSAEDQTALFNVAARCAHVAAADFFYSEGEDISELELVPLVVAVPETLDA